MTPRHTVILWQGGNGGSRTKRYHLFGEGGKGGVIDMMHICIAVVGVGGGGHVIRRGAEHARVIRLIDTLTTYCEHELTLFPSDVSPKASVHLLKGSLVLRIQPNPGHHYSVYSCCIRRLGQFVLKVSDVLTASSDNKYVRRSPSYRFWL